MEHQQSGGAAAGVAGASGDGGGNGGLMYVKVMSDEQMEVLRKQIAAYATICEKLVEMHKSFTAHQDLAGARLGNPYCDPMMSSGGHKYTSRQRWTPTPLQLQILECIFDQGTGTPTKQKIKDITTQLSQHGQISETNVYNWFQNRRARSKRKQLVVGPNNGESEVETEVESPTDKKMVEADNFQACVNDASRVEDLCFQSPDMSSDMHSLGPLSGKAESAAMSVGQLSFYDSMLSNPRMDHLMGKMEAAGSYNPYQQQTDNYPA